MKRLRIWEKGSQKKETQIDSLKEMVASKEVYIAEVEKGKKEIEVKYSTKLEAGPLVRHHFLEKSIFYGINC